MNLPAEIFRPPFWCWGLANWKWRTAGGQWQGFHLICDQPGLANLLWLALGGRKPSDGFDMRQYPFVMAVYTKGRTKLPSGETLEEWCAKHTLEEFTTIVTSDIWLAQMVDIAKVKVQHADS